MEPSHPTTRQREILEFIQRYVAEHGFPPSVREIARAFGIRSPNGAIYHLDRLEELGLIGREDGVARGIRVVHRG